MFDLNNNEYINICIIVRSEHYDNYLTPAFPDVHFCTHFIIFINYSKTINGISNRVFVFHWYTHTVCFKGKRNFMNTICA